VTAKRRAAAHDPPARVALGGGAVVWHEPSHAVPLVSIFVALRCGSAVDPPGKTGLARVAMRMLRRGCAGMTAEQIDFQIDALGAEMAVDTSPSTVAIHAQVIARNLDAFVGLASAMLASPTFPTDELERLKRESIAEIIDSRDNDRVVAQKALQRTLLEGHAYGQSSGGTTKSVAAIERDDVLAFYRRFVVQSNVVVGIAGDATRERAAEIAGRLVAGLARGEAAADAVAEPEMRPGRRLLVVDKPDRTQAQILVGTLGTSPHDADHVDLVVANGVFGGTFTSRLMKEVRSKRGWSYGASSRTSIDRRRQAWVMWTFPAAEDAANCLKLTLDLMDAWVERGVTPREVSFLKSYLVRSHAFEVDTASKRLHEGIDVELLGLPADYYSGWVDRVRAVTPEGASAAIKKRIEPENLLVVVVATASQLLQPLKAAVPRLSEVSVVPFDAE
jgi:zinc protease